MMFRKAVTGLVLISSAQAFTNIAPSINGKHASTVVCHVGQGWDNENYLENLGRGEAGQEQANEAYYRQSKYGRRDPDNDSNQQWGPQNPVMDVEDDEWPDFAEGGGVGQGGDAPPAYLQNEPRFMQAQQQQQQQQQAQNPFGQQGQNPFGQQQQQQPPQQQDPYMQQYGQQQQQYVEQQPGDPSTWPSQPIDNNDNQDELPNDDLEGAVFTPAMRAKIKASHTQDDERSGGGQQFRNLMARAQQQVPSQQQQQQQPMQQSMQPQMPNIPLPPNAMDLPIQEQARLFQDIMLQRQQQKYEQQYGQHQQGQQQGASYAQIQFPNYPYAEQAAKPQFLPPGTGVDGRKMGRNRDSDMISTSADVYLAQLKRDSSTRNMARINGDYSKSNDVFHDPKIQEINVSVNPYQVEARAKERDILQTIPEEMLFLQEFGKPPVGPEERASAGVNYKTKIAEAKQNKAMEQQQQQQYGAGAAFPPPPQQTGGFPAPPPQQQQQQQQPGGFQGQNSNAGGPAFPPPKNNNGGPTFPPQANPGQSGGATFPPQTGGTNPGQGQGW